MARAAIALTTTSKLGVEATYAEFNEADGSYFVNNQNTVLHIVNADVAAHVIHVISQATLEGKAVKDQVITVAAGDSIFLGPFSNSTWGSSGQVQVDCYNSAGPTFNNLTDAVSSGTKDSTDVTVAAIVIGSLG